LDAAVNTTVGETTERLGTEGVLTDTSSVVTVAPAVPPAYELGDTLFDRDAVKRVVFDLPRLDARLVVRGTWQSGARALVTPTYVTEPSVDHWIVLRESLFQQIPLKNLLFVGYSEGVSEAASPFEYLDSKNAVDVIDLLSTVTTLPRFDAKAILTRLNELFAISREEPEQRVMSARSLRYFLDFLRAYSEIRTPLVFLLDSGLVRAEWQVAQNKALAATFLPSGDVEYVALAPRCGRRKSTATLSGDNISWRDMVPALDESADISWLRAPSGRDSE
jgi:hypothetical protein